MSGHYLGRNFSRHLGRHLGRYISTGISCSEYEILWHNCESVDRLAVKRFPVELEVMDFGPSDGRHPIRTDKCTPCKLDACEKQTQMTYRRASSGVCECRLR